ncbi:MAG: hypothetical protein M3151_03895 [Actinomycetota bacterium]|nr:hypothetical protein [Actinomycetota bacterium]
MDRGEGFVLVDVLGEPYYRHSHLPGAINLPLVRDREGPRDTTRRGRRDRRLLHELDMIGVRRSRPGVGGDGLP